MKNIYRYIFYFAFSFTTMCLQFPTVRLDSWNVCTFYISNIQILFKNISFCLLSHFQTHSNARWSTFNSHHDRSVQMAQSAASTMITPSSFRSCRKVANVREGFIIIFRARWSIGGVVNNSWKTRNTVKIRVTFPKISWYFSSEIFNCPSVFFYLCM